MANANAVWEDDENNRQVELQVQYRIDDSRLEIEKVTPTSVQFVDDAKQLTRKIKVWTDAGRKHLLKKYSDHVGLDRLQVQLENDLLVAS